jgi:hypothetical protein
MRTAIAILLLMFGICLGASAEESSFPYQAGSVTLPESDLRSAQPIVCQGANRMELKGRHIVTDGEGIVVNGACTVVVKDSHIIAGGFGVVVNASSNVEIENSFIQGTKGAVVGHAMSETNYRNSTLRGGASKFAMAKVNDGGGNTHAKIPSPSRQLKASEPITCEGRERINVVHRFIETDGDGVIVQGNCEVTLSDSYIVAGGIAVRVSGEGSVRIYNSTLEGQGGALEVTESGRAHAAGSNLRGQVSGNLSDGGGNAGK